MGAIDSLLSLVESQHARGLVIAAGEAPQLVFADGGEPLSMPMLAVEQVEAFVREVGAASATGSRYETSSGEVFEVRVDGKGPSLRLSFARMLGEPAAAGPEPADPPSTPANSSGELDAPLLALLDRLEDEHVSDVLLSSGLPPRVRSGGELQTLAGPVLDDA